MHTPTVFSAATFVFLLGGGPTIHNSIFSNFSIAGVARDSISTTPRLSINPKEAATGTKTEVAGTRELPGFPGYYLHVPEQCVGTTRAPLIVLLHGGGRRGKIEVEKFHVLADKYGMVLLTGNARKPGHWDFVVSGPGADIHIVDSALKFVLRTNAIDPAKIALLGFSDGGSYSLFLGRANLDIFSRIAPLSPTIYSQIEGPPNKNVQFFLSSGVDEGASAVSSIKLARKLRKNGHAVVIQFGLRGHVDQVEDEDFVWAWLKDSWADPSITTKPIEIKHDPLLTENDLTRLAAFWMAFKKLPDSIKNEGRLANQAHVPMQLGTETVWTVLMNLPVMAKRYPVIADALKSAGITAEDAQAFRTAILAVLYAKRAGFLGGEPIPNTSYNGTGRTLLEPIPDSSIIAKNNEVLRANKVKFEELELAGLLKLQ